MPRSESKTRENNRGGSRIPHKRGHQPPGGTPTYNFTKFSKNLHQIEKNLGRAGGGWRARTTNRITKRNATMFFEENNVSLKKNNILFFMETNKENFPLKIKDDSF